jgi:hypothetical protein
VFYLLRLIQKWANPIYALALYMDVVGHDRVEVIAVLEFFSLANPEILVGWARNVPWKRSDPSCLPIRQSNDADGC